MDASLWIKIGMAPIALAALFYFVMLRPWRPQRMGSRRAPGVDLLFIGAALLGSLAVLQPAPFEQAAIALIETTDLPASLAEIDQRIEDVETLPERMWADLTAKLGWGGAVQPEDEVDEVDKVARDGLVSAAVLPAVHGVISALMRGFLWVGCLFVLAIAQVMRGLSGLRRREVPEPALRSFDQLIDDRVAALEESLHTRSQHGSTLQPDG
jgi:hypothetical protein